MNLPNLFTPTSGEARLFLSLYLNDQKVQAALWQVAEGQITVLHRSESRNFSDDDSAVKETDESLQELGKMSEGVEEVVFGFDPGWIQQGEIIDLKKPLLKRISKELNLKPVGFVVSQEAIVQQLSVDEPLLSALLMEISESLVRVTFIQRGVIKDTQEVGKSTDVVADLTEALARFEQSLGSEYLPSKILLFANDIEESDLKDYQQALVAHDWKQDHPFLHPPTIELQPASFLIDTITAQAGKAVVQAQGLHKQTDFTKSVSSDDPVEVPFPSTAVADNFGFAQVPVSPEENSPSTPDFAVPQSEASVTPHHDEPFSSQLTETTNPTKKPSLLSRLPRFNMLKRNRAVSTEHDSLPYSSPRRHSHVPFVGVGVLGGIIVLALIANWWLNSKAMAQVNITLNTQTISQEARLKLDPQASAVDVETLTLPAQTTTKEISGNKSIDTTGVKLIGDRAKGKVTLINKTDSEKSFEKGTVLATGNLKYTLDEAVSVASSSVTTSGDGETKTYGKTTAAVTAVDIGTESNIDKGKEFTVASFSTNTYQATNDEPMTGGSSREVRVVSAKDMANLKQDLTAQQQQEAQTQFSELSKDGIYYVLTGAVTTANATWSAKEGEETNTLALDQTVSVEALSYQVSELKPLVSAVLGSHVPSGYRLSSADPQILSSPDKESTSGGQLTLTAQLTAQALPNADLDGWKNEIAGQKITSAEAILKGKKEVKEVEITFQPQSLERLMRSIPKNREHIEMIIKE